MCFWFTHPSKIDRVTRLFILNWASTLAVHHFYSYYESFKSADSYGKEITVCACVAMYIRMCVCMRVCVCVCVYVCACVC